VIPSGQTFSSTSSKQMPKKSSWGVNEKAEAAKDRKNANKSAKSAQQKEQAEEDEWAAHANPKGKKDVKREEEQRKKEEAAAKKAELRRLQEQEEAEMANLGKKKANPKAGKVTAHELHLLKESQKKEFEKKRTEKSNIDRRQLTEEEYSALVEIENRNKEGDAVVDARSVEAALQQLNISGGGGEGDDDRHPEKRAKAAWNAYYEEMLPVMKEEKPGLRLMQYKSMIFDKWQKDPRNPRNQLNK
jgi:hypothetical protein